MNIDDERMASPMAGDASDRLRMHANPSAGTSPNDTRSGIGDPPWASPPTGRDAGIGTRSFPLPPPSSPYGARESASISSYFRQNLPAILIVCIIAAAIGIAVGSHFAAEPVEQVMESKPVNAHLRQDPAAGTAATPSDMIMQRIQEMRRIAAEDGVDEVGGTAVAGSVAASAPAASGAKGPEPGAEQGAGARQAQPAAVHRSDRSSGPCTAASMALALCDHQ